jgi:hypothetical protein
MNVGCMSQTWKGECSMSNNQSSKFVVLFVFSLAILLSGVAHATQRRGGDDKGESPKSRALKNRRSPPGQNNIDKAATLKSLLDKKNETDWSSSKGAVIEGYVIQVEKEEDGDYHIALAEDKGENDTNKWVIVEVTPAWRTRKASLSDSRLKQLHGKKVRVTGWLFYEPDTDQVDPRGTRWELHPVTDISVIEK